MSKKKSELPRSLPNFNNDIIAKNTLSTKVSVDLTKPFHIFALAGEKKAGKSFIGTQIIQICSVLNEGKRVHRLSFATPIKQLVEGFVGTQYAENFKTMVAYQGHTGRELYTTIGQGLRELVHEDIWADTLIKSLVAQRLEDHFYLLHDKESTSNRSIFIIDDLRHKNELTRLIDMFGKVNITTIRVIDPNSEGNKGTHISENDLNDVELDYVYYNPKTENHAAEHLVTLITKELLNKND